MNQQTVTKKSLSQNDVTFYREKGYLLPDQTLFSKIKFDRLKSRFEELLSKRGENGLDIIHFDNPDLLDFLLDESVLDIVESLIGKDIGLWSSHFISKEPNTGKATPWHEDSAYWEGRFNSFDNIVTIWLAIDKVDEENGCMRVIPGTHKECDSNYVNVDTTQNIFGSEISNIDESLAVYFEREPNQFSLHDSKLFHGAKANTSSRRRCGYTMRYFSQQMKFNTNHPGNQNHKLWHCRGQNIHNNPVVNG